MEPFVGVVLIGGSSRRMGTDKAWVEVDGVPMAERVGRALFDAGATRVLGVGGDAARVREIGLEPASDEHPGEGPLGGIVTGLRHAGSDAASDVVFVAACDLPWLDAATVAALVGTLHEADDAVDVVAAVQQDGRTLFLSAAYRIRSLDVLAAAFDEGERAVRRAAAGLRLQTVDGVDGRVLRDVDTPDDLGPGPDRR